MPTVATFLMFAGQAEDAMTLYTSVIPGSAVGSVTKYGPNEGAPVGTIKHASFNLGDQQFNCIDSQVTHAFSFTPAISIAISCSTTAEVDNIFSTLSPGGNIMMPLGPYPFSPRYAWFTDKFGVSWQVGIM